MMDIDDILINMRKSFSFLWDEHSFKLVGFMPKSGHLGHGYFVELENNRFKLVFQFTSEDVEDIYVAPKEGLSVRGGVCDWALMSTRDIRKRSQIPTTESVLNNFAEFARPHLVEMLEFSKTPGLFEEKLKELEETSKLVTIEMICAKRARLHSLGLDSSLSAAMKNIHKRV